MITYRVHPFAEWFPRISGEEYQAFKADIAEHGQRNPVIRLEDGTVIDGRNRLAVLAELGIEPIFATWEPRHEGDTPEAFIISENLHRRSLTDAQRTLIAARLVDAPHGGSYRDAMTTGKAAVALNVPQGMVARARRIIKHATPAVIAAVENGDMPISCAERIAQPTPKPRKPAQRERSHNFVPHEVDGPKPFLIEIREMIDGITARRDELAMIAKDMRVELVLSFARALGVAPAATHAEQRTMTGSPLG